MKRKEYLVIYRVCLNILILTLTFSCVPLFKGVQSMKDIVAPQFMGTVHPDETTILLNFDQAVIGKIEDFIPHGDFSLTTIEAQENSLYITLQDATEPGREYFLEGRVFDENNNALWFLIPFYGFNSNPARLVLSEFIAEHSSKRYEKVELYVVASGNLAGLTLYNGAAKEHKSKFVFGSQEVVEGEYIIVHFRSLEGSAEDSGQIAEYGKATDGSLNLAFSPHAISNVRDFWAEGAQGLSDTNGALSIYNSPTPDARLMDALLYSNRFFDPDDPHGSFGTATTWRIVQAIFDAGGWISEHDYVRPEDCLRIEASTPTRSINRGQLFTDNNSLSDWHIVPTGKSSFGMLNFSGVYEP